MSRKSLQSLGDASVLVSYDYERGEKAVLDVNSPLCGPGCDPRVIALGATINGEFVEADLFSDAVIAKWENRILEEIGNEQDERTEDEKIADLRYADIELQWDCSDERLAPTLSDKRLRDSAADLLYALELLRTYLRSKNFDQGDRDAYACIAENAIFKATGKSL